MSYVPLFGSAIRELRRDPLAVIAFAAIWISIPVALMLASASPDSENSPVIFLPIGVMGVFGWRARAASRRLGLPYPEQKIVAGFILLAVVLAVVAVVIAGSMAWMAVS